MEDKHNDIEHFHNYDENPLERMPSDQTMQAVDKMDYWKQCVDALDSASSRLGISAIDLAESLQDGGIAELVNALGQANAQLEACSNDIQKKCYDSALLNANGAPNIRTTILAKIKKGEVS